MLRLEIKIESYENQFPQFRNSFRSGFQKHGCLCAAGVVLSFVFSVDKGTDVNIKPESRQPSMPGFYNKKKRFLC